MGCFGRLLNSPSFKWIAAATRFPRLRRPLRPRTKGSVFHVVILGVANRPFDVGRDVDVVAAWTLPPTASEIVGQRSAEDFAERDPLLQPFWLEQGSDRHGGVCRTRELRRGGNRGAEDKTAYAALRRTIVRRIEKTGYAVDATYTTSCAPPPMMEDLGLGSVAIARPASL